MGEEGDEWMENGVVWCILRGEVDLRFWASSGAPLFSFFR